MTQLLAGDIEVRRRNATNSGWDDLTTSGRMLTPPPSVIAGYNGATNTLNSSAQTVRSYRVTHTTQQFLTDLRLLYGNYSPVTSTNAETGPGNANTVTAGIEFGGVTYQVTWNGATSVVIPNGATAPLSDPVPIDIPAGSTFFERTCITTAGSIGLSFYLRQNLDSFTFGSDVSTATGAMGTVDVSVPAQNAYTALAILGSSGLVLPPSVLILGDSIAAGTGDFVRTAADSTSSPGYVTRALADAVPWVNFSTSGCTLAQYNSAALTYQRRKLFSYFKFAIIELGTNDTIGGASLATQQASYIALATALANRGLKVFVCTQLPRVATTDGMLTTQNQTVLASESVRVAVNTWLRTVPVPFAGVFDTASLVEVNLQNVLTLNGGRWQLRTAALASGTSTGTNTSTTLNDTGQAWAVNGFQGISVVITAGTGVGQANMIVSNTATALTVNSAWSVTPDATSKYTIIDTPTLDGVHPNPSTAALLATGIPMGSFQ